MTDHPANSLDDVVHQRVRLGILAITQQARRVEFSFLRNELELTAGNLSQHLNVLDKAGLITLEKGYEGKRPRTWIHLTKEGVKALRDEVKALKALIQQVEADVGEVRGCPDSSPPRSAAVARHPRAQ